MQILWEKDSPFLECLLVQPKVLKQQQVLKPVFWWLVDSKDSKPWLWIFNCTFCFINIFRADLFLIDWGWFGFSFALSCSGQLSWQPSKDPAYPEVLSPASPDWQVQAWAEAAFVLSQWVAFSLGLDGSVKVIGCFAVGALSYRVYVGNCVHCSGLSSWCLHFSFLSARVNTPAWEWVGKGSCASSCSLHCVTEAPFPATWMLLVAQRERLPVMRWGDNCLD